MRACHDMVGMAWMSIIASAVTIRFQWLRSLNARCLELYWEIESPGRGMPGVLDSFFCARERRS